MARRRELSLEEIERLKVGNLRIGIRPADFPKSTFHGLSRVLTLSQKEAGVQEYTRVDYSGKNSHLGFDGRRRSLY